MTPSERVYWLAWSGISGIGPVSIHRLQNYFGSLAIAWSAPPQELGQVEGFGFKTLQTVREQRSRIDPENAFAEHLKKNPQFWTPADPEYPRLLLEIPNPPSVLYYRGEVDLLENLGQKPLIGIVGTRRPTEYGLRWTRQISTVLAKNGFTIVSGMAEGIDTESHSSTIKAGGRTLAVLGTGVDVVYPAKNLQLYKEILNNGLVLSEYPAKTPPERTNFPRRNRIIAGLTRAVLVMEAPIKSGALITANYANDFGRDVYALPGRLDDLPAQGCLKLLSQGATPIQSDLNELLKALGAIPQIDINAVLEVPPQQMAIPNISPQLQKVLDALSGEKLPLDLIIEQTGMAHDEVSCALLQLELMGLVCQLPGMRYQRYR